MATCFVCGSVLSKGAGVKKSVYTGASVGGFNLSSNIWLNVLLNSMFGDARSRARSYYSQKSVCSACADEIAARERRKITLLIVAAAFGALALFVFVLVLGR